MPASLPLTWSRPITKRGDMYLRMLLIQAAKSAVVGQASLRGEAYAI